jgi:hypothetical protein
MVFGHCFSVVYRICVERFGMEYDNLQRKRRRKTLVQISVAYHNHRICNQLYHSICRNRRRTVQNNAPERLYELYKGNILCHTLFDDAYLCAHCILDDFDCVDFVVFQVVVDTFRIFIGFVHSVLFHGLAVYTGISERVDRPHFQDIDKNSIRQEMGKAGNRNKIR